MSYSASILDVMTPYSKLLVIWNRLNRTEAAPLGTCREETLGWSIVATNTDLVLARSVHTEKGKATVANDLTVIPIREIVGIQFLDEVDMSPVVAPEPVHKASTSCDIRAVIRDEKIRDDARKAMEDKHRNSSPLLEIWALENRETDAVLKHTQDETPSVERARLVSNMITTWEQEDREDDTKHSDVVFDHKTPDTYLSPRADRIRLS